MTDRLTAWGPAAAWAGVLFFLSTVQGGIFPAHLFPGQDKVAHLVLYGVLGMALAWGRSRRPASAPRPVTLWGAGVFYGASDELHQTLTPGRVASAGDLAADAVGLALGYWLFCLFLRLIVERARRPS